MDGTDNIVEDYMGREGRDTLPYPRMLSVFEAATTMSGLMGMSVKRIDWRARAVCMTGL